MGLSPAEMIEMIINKNKADKMEGYGFFRAKKASIAKSTTSIIVTMVTAHENRLLANTDIISPTIIRHKVSKMVFLDLFSSRFQPGKFGPGREEEGGLL